MYKVRITTLDQSFGGVELKFERLTVMNEWLNVAFASGIEIAEITKVDDDAIENTEEEDDEW